METTEIIVIVQGITLAVLSLGLLAACVLLALRRRPVEPDVARRIAYDLVNSYSRGRDAVQHDIDLGVKLPGVSYRPGEPEPAMPPEVPDADIVNVTDAGDED